MGICSRGGTVFTAGTTDWAQVLGSGQEPRVDIITRNVIERLLSLAVSATDLRTSRTVCDKECQKAIMEGTTNAVCKTIRSR